MPKKLIINKWDRYWKLIILQEITQRGINRYFKCKCDCWNIKDIRLYNMVTNITKSCWCYNVNLKTTHWMSTAKIYNIWTGIFYRCYNKEDNHYKNYGWRWIKCEWKTFEEFYEDMWESYEKHCKEFWEKNTSIDRIDNNWNYSKENCRWATAKEQNRNRRDNRLYKWKCISQWIEELGLTWWTIRARLSHWWSIEKALFTKIWDYKVRARVENIY